MSWLRDKETADSNLSLVQGRYDSPKARVLCGRHFVIRRVCTQGHLTQSTVKQSTEAHTRSAVFLYANLSFIGNLHDIYHFRISHAPVKGRLSLGGQNKQTLKTLLSQGAYKSKHCRDLPCFALIVSEILQDLKLTEGFLCEMRRIKDEFQNEKIPTTLICLRGVTKTTKRAIIITKSCIYILSDLIKQNRFYKRDDTLIFEVWQC